MTKDYLKNKHGHEHRSLSHTWPVPAHSSKFFALLIDHSLQHAIKPRKQITPTFRHRVPLTYILGEETSSKVETEIGSCIFFYQNIHVLEEFKQAPHHDMQIIVDIIQQTMVSLSTLTVVLQI
jgi:hypothetical protein